MRILQKGIFLIFLCWFMPSLGEVQYKPISSLERNDFYFGWIFQNTFKGEKKRSLSGYSLKYDLLFPEINQLVLEKYRNFFKLGLGLGGSFFKKDYTEDNVCGSLKNPQTFIYYGGLKAFLTYFEYFAPFVEWGLARRHCFSYDTEENISFEKTSNNFKSYLSFGLFLSFKLIDRVAIYRLDRDYGINDIGIVGQCSSFYKERVSDFSEKKSFCEVGLSVKL